MAAFKNKIFTLNGNGEQRRDYVYLNDLVKLIHKLLSNKYKNIIINVATGVSFSLNEIIDMFKKKLKKEPSIKIKNDSKNFDLNFDISF